MSMKGVTYTDVMDPHAVDQAKRYEGILAKAREAAATPEGKAKEAACIAWVHYCGTLERGADPTVAGFKVWQGSK